MSKITESEIESFAIELLEKRGYRYSCGPDIAPDGESPARASFGDVLLMDRLERAVGRINHSVPLEAREDAIKQLTRLSSPELVATNEAFHRMLTEGVPVSYQKDGQAREQRLRGCEPVHRHRTRREQEAGPRALRQWPSPRGGRAQEPRGRGRDRAVRVQATADL